jgi:hypothetical protein
LSRKQGKEFLHCLYKGTRTRSNKRAKYLQANVDILLAFSLISCILREEASQSSRTAGACRFRKIEKGKFII